MYKSRIRNAKQRGKNEKSKEMEFPDDDQEYAVVERMLGNGRVEVYCNDKKLRTVRIRGSMRKFKTKVIIETSDLVLISRWEFEPEKGDLIHKYTYEEKNYLLYQQMLPENIHKKLNKNSYQLDGVGDEDDDQIVFGDSDIQGGTRKPNGNDDINIDDI